MSDVKIKMDKIGNQITDLKIEYEKLRGNYIKELQEKLSNGYNRKTRKEKNHEKIYYCIYGSYHDFDYVWMRRGAKTGA